MKEKLLWLLFGFAIVAIFVVSKGGFYRYPCQDPDMWLAPECTPPICLRTKSCATDLTGASE
jgi:hypothetical protein